MLLLSLSLWIQWLLMLRLLKKMNDQFRSWIIALFYFDLSHIFLFFFLFPPRRTKAKVSRLDSLTFYWRYKLTLPLSTVKGLCSVFEFLFACFPIYLYFFSVYPSIYPSFCLSVCLSVHLLSVCLFLCVHTCLFIWFHSVCLSIFLFICLLASLYLSHLSLPIQSLFFCNSPLFSSPVHFLFFLPVPLISNSAGASSFYLLHKSQV